MLAQKTLMAAKEWPVSVKNFPDQGALGSLTQ